jgi:hypothetical protein
MNFCTKSRVLLAIALGLAVTSSGCGYENTFKAEQAKTSLVGMSELELESCVGLPDKEATKGKTTLLVYNAPNATTRQPVHSDRQRARRVDGGLLPRDVPA